MNVAITLMPNNAVLNLILFENWSDPIKKDRKMHFFAEIFLRHKTGSSSTRISIDF